MYNPTMTRSKEYSEGNYDKLVRDKVPHIIATNHMVPVTHIEYGDNYVRRLRAKLQEELGELIKAETPEELDEEIGDVMEVLYAYAQQGGRDMRVIESKRQTKRTTHGGFATGTVLDRVENPK